jgi:ABC-type phosphate transport system permease subunit
MVFCANCFDLIPVQEFLRNFKFGDVAVSLLTGIPSVDFYGIFGVRDLYKIPLGLIARPAKCYCFGHHSLNSGELFEIQRVTADGDKATGSL